MQYWKEIVQKSRETERRCDGGVDSNRVINANDDIICAGWEHCQALCARTYYIYFV